MDLIYVIREIDYEFIINHSKEESKDYINNLYDSANFYEERKYVNVEYLYNLCISYKHGLLSKNISIGNTIGLINCKL